MTTSMSITWARIKRVINKPTLAAVLTAAKRLDVVPGCIEAKGTTSATRANFVKVAIILTLLTNDASITDCAPTGQEDCADPDIIRATTEIITKLEKEAPEKDDPVRDLRDLSPEDFFRALVTTYGVILAANNSSIA